MNSFVIFGTFLALASAAPQYLSGAPANPLPVGFNAASGNAPAPAVFSAPGLPVAPATAVFNSPAGPGTGAKKVATIVKDERTAEDDGSYSVNVETSDGIILSESGSPSKTAGSFTQQGSISFTHPGGEKFDLKYVADENGFQPQSANLPVAPAFPHPIPQFVLDQIAFAAAEDKKAAEAAKNAPSAPGATASFQNSAPASAPVPSASYSAPAPAPAAVVPVFAPAVAPAPPSSVYGFPG